MLAGTGPLERLHGREAAALLADELLGDRQGAATLAGKYFS
jgi:hypothetical protein